jgi:Icc-related predicted phosphoesterase
MVNSPHSMGHFQFIPELRMMTIRGARSIDQSQRTEGVDWFRDEELSMQQCEAVLTMVDEYKPKIILSHDCPTEIGVLITGENKKSRTDQMLQACFDRHQPELWIHGHFHVHHEAQMKGTKFLGLGELEIVEI